MKLKLGPYMDSRLMYHVYLNHTVGVYIFLYFFNFLSPKFQNIKFFVTLFCEAYKVETWYTHGQRVDLLCTPNTSNQNILVPLFYFFLSLTLAKIKNLLLQNCFSMPLMVTARGVWAVLTLCYILMQFFILMTIYEPQHDKTNDMAYTPSENSDQSGHPPSLIRVFAVHSLGS